MDPLNRVVVAIDDTTQDIVCAAFLRELSSTPQSASSEPCPALLFAIYGVWTLPSARRQGIALALLEEVKRIAEDVAKVEDRGGHLEVDAYEQNMGAVKLYSKAGFVALEPADNGLLKLVLTL
jgi:GNAT superfamily N-acetyltransferase